jgi:flavodoxin
MKTVPSEIRRVYDMMKRSMREFPMPFAREARGIMHELVVNTQMWYGGDIEPDWDAFMNEIDELCYKYNIPLMFGAVRGEYR